MGMRGKLLMAFMAGLWVSSSCRREEGKLQVGYYGRKCPMAEVIVRDEVSKAVGRNAGLAAGLVRMHFHDCFVRGCDGSVLIDSTKTNTAEKDAPPNNPSLRGFEVIDRAKLRLEAACKGVVSCADILAFAARDSVVMSGGIRYEVPAGRRDGSVSLASEASASLPPPTSNLNQLTQIFSTKGLTQNEMITLSGAHTIGGSHCSSFSSRLYGFFNSSGSQDPSLDPTYAAQLKQRCSAGSRGAGLVVPMDPVSPALLDTSYYGGILAQRGLFTSDQTLVSTPGTAAQVREYAANARVFQRDFGAAMVKMGQIGVLTGRKGEIRADCRVIN